MKWYAIDTRDDVGRGPEFEIWSQSETDDAIHKWRNVSYEKYDYDGLYLIDTTHGLIMFVREDLVRE